MGHATLGSKYYLGGANLSLRVYLECMPDDGPCIAFVCIAYVVMNIRLYDNVKTSSLILFIVLLVVCCKVVISN